MVEGLQNGELFLPLQISTILIWDSLLQATFNICHVSEQKMRSQKALQRRSILLRLLLGLEDKETRQKEQGSSLRTGSCRGLIQNERVY